MISRTGNVTLLECHCPLEALIKACSSRKFYNLLFHFLLVSCVALCSICLFTRIHVLISRFLFVGCKHFFAPLLHFLFSFSPMISQSPPLSALTTRLGINKTGTKSVLCKIFNNGVNFLSTVEQGFQTKTWRSYHETTSCSRLHM